MGVAPRIEAVLLGRVSPDVAPLSGEFALQLFDEFIVGELGDVDFDGRMVAFGGGV